MFTVDRSGSKARQTPIALPRKQKQIYGGLFAGWFELEGKFGKSVGIKALVTHVAAGNKWEPLEKITIARCVVPQKWWYDSKEDKGSYLLAFTALVADESMPKVEKATDVQIKDYLNGAIGTGLTFSAFVELDKDQKPRNAIDKDTFDAPDAEFVRISKKMRPRLEVVFDDDGFAYIAKPEPVYADPTQAAAPAPADTSEAKEDEDDGFGGAADDDEIPF